MSTNINDIYKSTSNYLKVADLQGRKVNVTIGSAELEDLNGKKMVAIGFKESDKKFTLNRTNANMIAFLLGTEDYTNWIGARITLKPSMTEYQGKATPCIRVADELPPQNTQPDPPAQTFAAPPPAPPIAQGAAFAQQPFGAQQGGQQVSPDDIPF